MNTIFMISENGKTSNPHRLLLNLNNKIDLWRGEKCIALSNPSFYCTWKNIEKSYKNNKCKISAPTWSDKFKLPDESYFVSDI